MYYLLLIAAILAEVVSTLALKESDGWSRPIFGVLSLVGYAFSGWLFAFVLQGMNMGLAYTIWSGVGIVAICAASSFIYSQTFDVYAIAGAVLICAGVVLISVKSDVLNYVGG